MSFFLGRKSWVPPGSIDFFSPFGLLCPKWVPGRFWVRQVLQMFAKVAAGPDSRLEGKSYTDILRQRSDLLQKLVHLAEEQKERLQARSACCACWCRWPPTVFSAGFQYV